jgi:hypothetical protein
MQTQHAPPSQYRYRFGSGSIKHRISILKSAREYRERRRLYRNYYDPTPFERLDHLERIIREGKFHG